MYFNSRYLEIKQRQLIWRFVLYGILIIIFNIWLVIRDPRLVASVISKSNVSEFAYLSSFCDSLPLCYRFNSALIPNLIINCISYVLEKMSVINDPYHNFHVSNLDRSFLIFITISLFYRLLLFTAAGYFIRKIFGFELHGVLLFFIYFFLVNSAIIQTKIISLFINYFGKTTYDWLYRIQIMYLTFFDYLQPLLVFLLIILFNNLIINNNLKIKWFFIGLILTTFLDHAGFLASIYMLIKYLKNKNIKIFPSVYIFFGSAAYLFLYRLFFTKNNLDDTSIFELWNTYFHLNTARIKYLPFLIFFILILPNLFMFAFGYATGNKISPNNSKFLNYEKDIFIMMQSLCVLYVLSYFTSALTVEFGRITFAFQVLSAAYVYCKGTQKYFLRNG